MVLHLGDQDGVAGRDVGSPPGVCDQVDRLGGVLGEDRRPWLAAHERRRPAGGRRRRPRPPPGRARRRRGGCWRCGSPGARPARRSPPAGFCAVAPESRYTSGRPSNSRAKIGKSARTDPRGVSIARRRSATGGIGLDVLPSRRQLACDLGAHDLFQRLVLRAPPRAARRSPRRSRAPPRAGPARASACSRSSSRRALQRCPRGRPRRRPRETSTEGIASMRALGESIIEWNCR